MSRASGRRGLLFSALLLLLTLTVLDLPLGLDAVSAVLLVPLAGAALLAGFRTRLVAAATIPLLLGALMVHAGMPELRTYADITYLKDRLLLDEPDHAAEAHFKEEMNPSLETKTRRYDDFVHNPRISSNTDK